MFMPKSEKILVLGSNSFGGASYVNFALDKGFKVNAPYENPPHT